MPDKTVTIDDRNYIFYFDMSTGPIPPSRRVSHARFRCKTDTVGTDGVFFSDGDKDANIRRCPICRVRLN